MSIQDLNKLLDKYDKLRSVANSGSSDKRIISKFKFLRRVAEWKWFKKFSINTYDFPFASNRIRREVRSTLINILRLHEINYWRTERNDKSSKESIDIINEYLKEIPKRPSLVKRLEDNSWGILGVAVGILPIILSNWSGGLQIILIIVGLGVMFPFVLFYSSNRILSYVLERDLYKYWMKKLAIEDLRHRIINELVQLNDKTYVELETKYK